MYHGTNLYQINKIDGKRETLQFYVFDYYAIFWGHGSMRKANKITANEKIKYEKLEFDKKFVGLFYDGSPIWIYF